MVITLSVALALVAGLVIVMIVCARRGVKRSTAKVLFGANIGLLLGLFAISAVLLFSGNSASAADAADASNTAGLAETLAQSNGLAFLSAAISTGLATIGAGIGVAFTGSAALGAISEDQTLLGKTLIFVGLAEGTAIYGLIVSILILGYVVG